MKSAPLNKCMQCAPFGRRTSKPLRVLVARCCKRYVSLVVSFTVLPGISSASTPRCDPLPELLSAPRFEWPMPAGTTADTHSCNTGFVMVEFDILTNGSVADPRVIDSKFVKGCRTGDAKDDFFHAASMSYISQWQFQSVKLRCSHRHRLSFETAEGTFGNVDK